MRCVINGLLPSSLFKGGLSGLRRFESRSAQLYSQPSKIKQHLPVRRRTSDADARLKIVLELDILQHSHEERKSNRLK
jgi:hypothetical protein